MGSKQEPSTGNFELESLGLLGQQALFPKRIVIVLQLSGL